MRPCGARLLAAGRINFQGPAFRSGPRALVFAVFVCVPLSAAATGSASPPPTRTLITGLSEEGVWRGRRRPPRLTDVPRVRAGRRPRGALAAAAAGPGRRRRLLLPPGIETSAVNNILTGGARLLLLPPRLLLPLLLFILLLQHSPPLLPRLLLLLLLLVRPPPPQLCGSCCCRLNTVLLLPRRLFLYVTATLVSCRNKQVAVGLSPADAAFRRCGTAGRTAMRGSPPLLVSLFQVATLMALALLHPHCVHRPPPAARRPPPAPGSNKVSGEGRSGEERGRGQ